MPLIQVSVPAGSLDAAKKAKMIELITEASVTAEGIPAARQFTWVQINEVPDGGWGMGGQAITLDMMKVALGQK